jgi:hypothetical protein
MAENTTLFSRLRKLFSTDVIIRNVGGDQIKVVDVGHIQSDGNIATNRRVDRFSRLFSAIPGYSYSAGQLQLYTRLELFRDYEAMDTDSIISSALDIYADECTAKNEFGDVLTVKTSNPKVQKVLHNLFYDVMNVEFNLWPWIRNTVKYGDFFLHMHIAEGYGVIGIDPISPYEMIREENFDPENPQKVRFKRDYTALSSKSHVASTNETAQTYDNYEIAHFRLLTDTNFLPYGRALIEPTRKVWKQITLMEDAMLIHRIMRAPDKRVFKIDIGNIPPNEVDAFMEGMVSKMKKVPYMDPTTGDYNLKYNMQNLLEDFYLPVRGTESGTSIDTLAGINFDSIQDIEYLKNRLLGSHKIPKAYLGYEEDTSGKATLASQDFRFARTIERVQRIIASELYKIGIVHLYAQGFTDEDLVDFSLSLTAPSSVYEKEKVELWTSKVTLAGDMVEKALFSKPWIYENLFNLSEEQYLEEQNKIIEDAKTAFRLEQIKTEGNDPIKTGQSFGTAHDIASLYKNDGGVPRGYDEKSSEMPPKGWPGAGRPTEPGSHGTHEHPLGWDPLGNKTNRKVYEGSKNSLDAYGSLLNSMKGLRTAKKKALNETFEKENIQESSSLLDESNILPEE